MSDQEQEKDKNYPEIDEKFVIYFSFLKLYILFNNI